MISRLDVLGPKQCDVSYLLDDPIGESLDHAEVKGMCRAAI